MLYVNDMLMMVETEEALQHNVDTVNERLVRWDLKVKWRKMVMGVARK